MREFKDDLGRSWNIHISSISLKRIFEHAGFDVADLQNNKALEIFTGETTHLLDVMWPLVKPEADTRGISYEAFGEGLRGDANDNAIAVLKEELLSFFPSRKRKLVETLLDKLDKAMVAGEKRLEQLNPESGQTAMASGGNSPTTVQAS